MSVVRFLSTGKTRGLAFTEPQRGGGDAPSRRGGACVYGTPTGQRRRSLAARLVFSNALNDSAPCTSPPSALRGFSRGVALAPLFRSFWSRFFRVPFLIARRVAGRGAIAPILPGSLRSLPSCRRGESRVKSAVRQGWRFSQENTTRLLRRRKPLILFERGCESAQRLHAPLITKRGVDRFAGV